MCDPSLQIFIGNIIHCNKPFSIEVIENGFIGVQGAKIVEVGKNADLEIFLKNRTKDAVQVTYLEEWQILIPGFIDTHIHASQYLNLGIGLDKPLLQWLKDHTFPLEKEFQDLDFAAKSYDLVVKETLSNGTTTASYYATIHTDAALVLADIAIKHGQRALIGKINMTANCPPNYSETPEQTIEATKRFIKEMAKKKSTLVQPIITPRFAISLKLNDMKKLGKLAKDYNLRIQTHLCESEEEIATVKNIFSKEYGQVYIDSDILTEKSIMAHAVHMPQAEIDRLVQKKSSVAHCPSSNFNLRSGICDVKKLVEAGVNVGLGTDISGGSNVGIVGEMRHAMMASLALSFQKQNYEPINYSYVFYLATLGGAKALTLDDVVGNFTVGKEFDALVIDLKGKNAGSESHTKCLPLEVLQKFIYVGDDRNITSVFVAGQKVK